jgi:hypothetical protein
MDDDERVYLPSWSLPLKLVAILIVAVSGGRLASLVLRGRPHGSFPLGLLVGYALIGGAFVLVFRCILLVRVSRSGLRGMGGRLMKWSDVTAIERGRGLFGGFSVKSPHAPTVTVSESIAANPESRVHVLALVAPDHPLAERLRERAH